MQTSVNDFSPFLGQPIRSVQTMLREVGSVYEEMPNVIPDGIYGTETEASVRWFQQFSNLPVTGVTDKLTWDTLLKEYVRLSEQRQPPRCIRILPDDFAVIFPGEERRELTVIQALLKNLSQELVSISDLEITGIHDGKSVQSVQSVQKILGKEEHGNIDKDFWNDLIDLYETHVSNPAF